MMYQYNKSRSRATLSPKEGPFFGPQFSLQASATTVNERPGNKPVGFLGSRDTVPVKVQEVFSVTNSLSKLSSSPLAQRSFGGDSPSFTQPPGGGLLSELSTRTASAGVLSNMPGGGSRGSLNPRALVSPNLIATSRHGALKPGQSNKRHVMPTAPFLQEWMLIGQDLISDSSAASTPVSDSPLPQRGGFSPPYSTVSSGPRSPAYYEGTHLPGDRVLFAESQSHPGVPVVYRTPEERASNPDRLNLDRRKLSVCPIIEGEEQLRLLNYQHNLISCIEHLSGLRRLIFLDLYDNQIEEISGLCALKSLRVLMLGKNRIKKIENLDALVKLDVLDLHCNQISTIENLNHLTELRVLNLAGNQIEHVDNLAGLSSVKEINLRRNHISTITEVDSLPHIEKLFLSFNDISSFEDIGCIRECSTLVEISLDGNPLCQESLYKQTVLSHMPQLRQLDMRRVGDDERRIASLMAKKDEEKKRETDKLAKMKERRKVAINNARKQWELMQTSVLMQSKRHIQQPMPDLVANHVANVATREFLEDVSESSRSSEKQSDRPTSAKSNGAESSRPPSGASRPTSAKSFHSEKDTWPHPNSRPSSTSTASRSNISEKSSTIRYTSASDGSSQNVDYLSELEGDTLSLYGAGSLESLDKNWGMAAAGAVTTITFKFIEFDEIIKHLHKIRARFPSVHTLCFNSTNICYLAQFNALSGLRRLDNITIESDGNPVTNFLLWKNYLLFRLAHFSLKKINDVEVSATDIVNAEKFFGSLSHITTSQLPQSRLVTLVGESKKKQLLAMAEDKRKSPDTKVADRNVVESVGRAGLIYINPDLLQQKTREQKTRKQFVHSYITELSKEATVVDHKRNALEKVWPQVFTEMVYTAVVEMWDTKAYMKSCMEDILQQRT